MQMDNVHELEQSEAQVDRLTIRRPGRSSRTVILDKQQLFIGRSPNNDIVLDAPGVSHWHACLEQTAGGWQSSALCRNSGIFLNQRRLVHNVAEPWPPGQTLRIGPYLLQWQRVVESEPYQPFAPPTAAPVELRNGLQQILPLGGVLLLLFTAIFTFSGRDKPVTSLVAGPTAVVDNPAPDDALPQTAAPFTVPVLDRSRAPEIHRPGRGENPDTPALPVIFSANFSKDLLEPTTWAYHIYRGIAVVREGAYQNVWSSNAELVLQLGHPQEWSAITLEKGYQWRNYIVEMDVQLLDAVEDADGFFLGVRHDRSAGEYAVSLDVAGQRARLSSTINGLWEGTFHETSLPLALDTWYRLKAHVEDHTIRFYIDDQPIGIINNDQLTAGTIRMMTPPGGFVYVDNIIVMEIPSWPEPGDLLITEFLFGDDGFQWFEIMNHSERHIRLDGLAISNGRESHQIASGLPVMTPYSYMLFASQDPAPYFPLAAPLYIYGHSLRFPLDDGKLRLSAGGRTITEIEYSEDTGWLLQDNVSLALHPDHHTPRGQHNGFHWCPSVAKASHDPLLRATPGQPNHLCVRELPIHHFSSRQSGDLIITEIMVDLPGPDQGREWFEVYNPTDRTLSLRGLTIATNSPAEKHTITEEFIVPPRSYVVLAQAGLLTNELPDHLPVYYYPGHLSLRNSDGEIVIYDGERVLDNVTWRDNGWWPFRGGVAMSLHPDALSAYFNDDALNWCLAWTPIPSSPGLWGTPGEANDPCPMWEINSPLQDAARAYEATTLAPVTMYITVDPTDLDSMKANPFSNREFSIQFSAAGYETEPGHNATMRPRGGNFTRAAENQSYTIRLDEPFQGHSTLLLNKHESDPSRLRNALSFQLFQEMDNMVSLRTQFVHLFVNGEDFGLYTQVESRGSQMLRTHRLDDRGHLFNIEYGFFLYDVYDRERRNNSILVRAELQAGHNHDGLIRMMDAVYSEEDTQQIIDRHFNRENLLTYFAAVYLMQNLDTRAKNYLLYSTPREPDRFYFMPWDWDLAFFPREERTFFVGSWREGLGNWAGIGIFDRMMREPELVDALIFKMVELAQTSLSPDRVNLLAEQLEAEVEPFTRRQPELRSMTPASLRAEVELIKSIIAGSAQQLVDFIEYPLPFAVDMVHYDAANQAVTFTWNESVSLQNRPLAYEVVLFSQSRWDAENIVWRSRRTTETSLTITSAEIPDEVRAGPYYWMVYVWDDQGYYNSSYNMDEFGVIANVVNLP